MSIQQLPQGVIKQISSAQVINSVSSAVKELMENALDAGATVIDVKLERNGLDKIEIRDNACGISAENMNFVCLPHYTSKISSFDDLERLQSYGFRGEALHSLCAVSQLSITTKTEQDEVASTYIFDNNGTVRDIKSSHQMKGTVITVTNLFRNVPVRKQYYESSRKAAEELKKVEKVVKQLSVIHSKLRVTLAHNKCLIWHKTSVYNLRQSLMQVYPSAVLKNLKDAHYSFENVSIEMLIANRDCNLPVLLQPANEAVLLYINQRPVKDKKIEKVVFEETSHLFASALPVNKYPLTLLSLTLSPEWLDVNLEPNKTKVFIKDHEEILKNVREAIMRHFYQSTCTNDMDTVLLDDEDLQNPTKKLKLQENPDVRVSNELDVLEMRNLIIEKAKVDGKMAAEKLDDINLSIPDQFKTSLPDSEMEKLGRISNSKDRIELDRDSCVPTNGDILNATLDVENPESLVKNSDLFMSDHQSRIPLVDSFDITLPFISDDLTEEFDQLNAQRSCISNENTLKRSLIEDNNEPLFALDRKNNNCDTKSNESNHDKLFPIFSNENLSKETNHSKSMDNSITPSQWSKGHVAIADEPLKGGVILFNDSKITDYMTPKKSKFDEETKQTCISNDVMECEDTKRHVSSPSSSQNVSSLTSFARRVRSEMAKEKPAMSFGVVAKELANRWNELHDDKKKSPAEDSLAIKRKSISDFKPKETFKRKSLALKISTNQILEELKIPGRIYQRAKKNRIALIGPLETATKWLYEFNDDVSVVDVDHLQENVLLHRYMCNSSILSKRLEEPIAISSEIMDEALWNFLLTLDRISDDGDESISIISDGRITKNGFKVIVKKSYNSFEVLITEIAKESDVDVVDNLVETLKLALQFKELEKCRSGAAKMILLDKVMEACKQKTLPKETTEIRMLLQYWVQCMLQKRICPHDEPISVNLHKL